MIMARGTGKGVDLRHEAFIFLLEQQGRREI